MQQKYFFTILALASLYFLSTIFLFGCAIGANIPAEINGAYVPPVGGTGPSWIMNGDSYTLTSTRTLPNGCREGILNSETGAANFTQALTKLEGQKESHTITVCPDSAGNWKVISGQNENHRSQDITTSITERKSGESNSNQKTGSNSATASSPQATETSMGKKVVTATMIKKAQSQLTSLGYAPGPADGIMGLRTRSAIANFQRNNGLTVTRELNSETMIRLENGDIRVE